MFQHWWTRQPEGLLAFTRAWPVDNDDTDRAIPLSLLGHVLGVHTANTLALLCEGPDGPTAVRALCGAVDANGSVWHPVLPSLVPLLLAMAVRHQAWSLWAALVQAYPAHWFRMIVSADEFGLLHTVMLAALQNLSVRDLDAVLDAVSQTVSSLTTAGCFLPANWGSSVVDVTVPSDIANVTATCLRLCASHPVPMRSALTQLSLAVDAVHLVAVEPEVIETLLRTLQGAADPTLAVLCSRWMSRIGEETLNALWASQGRAPKKNVPVRNEWMDLLPVAVAVVRGSLPSGRAAACALAEHLARSVQTLCAQRPKIKESFQLPGVDWEAWARGRPA